MGNLGIAANGLNGINIANGVNGANAINGIGTIVTTGTSAREIDSRLRPALVRFFLDRRKMVLYMNYFHVFYSDWDT